MYDGILFAVLILLILFVVWGSTIENEERKRAELDKYVEQQLFGKNATERKFVEDFTLAEGQEMWIFGINHLKTLGWYWRFQIFTLDNKLLYTHTSEECGDEELYTVKLSSGVRKGCLTIDTSFRLQESVWTKRKMVIPRVFVIE